jgi:hypothetical protein
MRYRLLALGSVACLGLYQGWFAQAYDQATTAALTKEARLAIDIRCRAQEGHAAGECRSLLKKLYLSKSLDPNRTLRVYCDSFKNTRRGGGRSATPELCAQLNGGPP